MTLEVVHDSNVVQFPQWNLSDVTGSLRRLADDIDAGKYEQTINSIVILECGEGVVQFHWGESSNALEAIGLLSVAKQKIIDTVMSAGD